MTWSMSKERAQEIADDPGMWSALDGRRDVLRWALDELSARDGEIISLKARIAALDLTAPLQAATILRAEKAESRLTTIQTMCDAAVEKKLRQRVPPFGAVVTVERLRAVLRSTA